MQDCGQVLCDWSELVVVGKESKKIESICQCAGFADCSRATAEEGQKFGLRAHHVGESALRGLGIENSDKLGRPQVVELVREAPRTNCCVASAVDQLIDDRNTRRRGVFICECSFCFQRKSEVV